MFIETICSDAIVEKNIRAVKLQSPDYKGWDPEEAVKDYWSRIRAQEQSYQAIQNPSFPYVKVLDVGERIIVNNIQGYLQSRTVFFLMNIHNRYRRIYFARSGASYAEHSYKADAGLSEVGEAYATALRDFVLAKREKDRQDPAERERQRRLVVSSIPTVLCPEVEAKLRSLIGAGVDLLPETVHGHGEALSRARVQGHRAGQHDRDQPGDRRRSLPPGDQAALSRRVRARRERAILSPLPESGKLSRPERPPGAEHL